MTEERSRIPAVAAAAAVTLPPPWADAQVAVVVPTYNEAGNIAELTERIFALPLPNLRLFIVDDGSPDGTGALADELAASLDSEPGATPGRMRVIHREVKDGIGRAHMAGMVAAMAAGADYVVQMDGDLSHPPEFIPQLLGTLLATDAGVVIGSRYVIGGSLSQRWGLHRRLLSRFAGAYVRGILGLDIRDVTAGFKVWRTDVLAHLDLGKVRSSGYSFQVEMNHRCNRLGHKIVEVPIHFAERNTGHSKIDLGVYLESFRTPLALRLASRSDT